MTTFKETLATLPSIDHLQKLELYPADSYEACHTIENIAGKSGSLAVYYKVAVDHGGIGPSAAKQALTLFCEHVADAEANPGKHPNIDFLFKTIADDQYYSVKAVNKTES